MKYYLIAGEASGDLHGSNLMRELKNQDLHAEFRFWGGDKMSALGGTPVKHIRDLAFMGFAEVLLNLRTIVTNLKLCKQDVLSWKPDALILIDYPGFNMRIAEFAHRNNVAVHYYISPQVWAWKQNRVHKLKRICDEMYCILPFEKAFYARFDFEVDYVGHPLIDAIREFRSGEISDPRKEFDLTDGPILALLPGSRKQEIAIKLPIMLKAAEAFTGHRVVVAAAPNVSEEFYQNLMSGFPVQRIKLIQSRTYDILGIADLAMVTSGTATLETALFKVPQVVCYKGGAISYQIAKQLIKVKYISLVNLIMDKPLVTELIQGELTPENIIKNLKRYENPTGDERKKLIDEYSELEKILGGGGASKKTASLIIEKLHQNK